MFFSAAHTAWLRIAVAAAAALVAACAKEAPPPQMPPPEVAALEVHPRDLPLTLEYAAQLRGVREVEVRARVSGILLKRNFTEGGTVRRGQ